MSVIALILLAGLAYAQPRNGPQMYWPHIPDDTSSGNTAMSAAATWLAVGFQASASRTLSEVHLAILSTTGSPGSTDLRMALYSDSAGKPGTEIEARDSTSAPIAGGNNSITGYTSSVTAGTTYWIVIRNMAGTPASNYFTVTRRTTSISGYGISTSATSGTQGGWMSANSTDSGTNWTRSTSMSPLVVVWSDGTIEGVPFTATGATCQVYAARECGLHIRTGVTGLRVTGVAAMVSKTASPTGSARFRLYEGTGNSRTLVATTNTTASVSTTISYTQLWFTSAIVLKAWTWYTLALSETTQSDASTDRFNLVGYAVRASHAGLFSSMLGADTNFSLSTDGGSTWTDTADNIHHAAFLLDSRAPYVIPSGGFAITQ